MSYEIMSCKEEKKKVALVYLDKIKSNKCLIIIQILKREICVLTVVDETSTSEEDRFQVFIEEFLRLGL